MSSRDSVLCSHCRLPVKRHPKSQAHNTFCCYSCAAAFEVTGEHGEAGQSAVWLIRLGLGGFWGMNVMLFSWLLYSDAVHSIGAEIIPAISWILLALATPVVLMLGWPFLIGGLRQLKTGVIAMDALIALGSVPAYGYSAWATTIGREDIYFDTAAMIVRSLAVIVNSSRLRS